jgi:hypothetical protein
MPRPYRLQSVVSIDLLPAPSPAQGELVMERLACGHEGVCHGPTWSGTAALGRRRVAYYTHHIGTRRRCTRCASVGQEERHA